MLKHNLMEMTYLIPLRNESVLFVYPLDYII
jgi:hypothetical protein